MAAAQRSPRRLWLLDAEGQAYTKNCTFEPVLDGEQGREVTKAFNAVVNG
jgi:hypothetical protein